MRLRDEIPSEALFARFKSYATAYLRSAADAAAFLTNLRHDADADRDLVTREGGSPAAGFYARVIEDLELGSFIPLLLWLISDHHAVPEAQARQTLAAIESMAVRRTLLRMTTKDFNNLVVAILKALDGIPVNWQPNLVSKKAGTLHTSCRGGGAPTGAVRCPEPSGQSVQ